MEQFNICRQWGTPHIISATMIVRRDKYGSTVGAWEIIQAPMINVNFGVADKMSLNEAVALRLNLEAAHEYLARFENSIKTGFFVIPD